CRDFMRVEHRAARRARGVAHVAVPVLAGALDADLLAVLQYVRDDDDLWAARHTPALAENIKGNVAKTLGEGDLLRRGNLLTAEKDHAVLVEGALDHRKDIVAERLGQVHSADFGAQC